jgi:hypothetical protein
VALFVIVCVSQITNVFEQIVENIKLLKKQMKGDF